MFGKKRFVYLDFWDRGFDFLFYLRVYLFVGNFYKLNYFVMYLKDINKGVCGFVFVLMFKGRRLVSECIGFIYLY